jgi:type I restriction enzyme S subunit
MFKALSTKVDYEALALPNINGLHALPQCWAWSVMDDVLLAIEAGKSFTCEERPPSSTEVGVVKVSSVTWGRFDELESKTVIDSERINSDYFIENGDFLFSRANTIELVGRCVIVQNITRRLMLSDKILRFRLVDISPKWILFYLSSLFGRHEIERLATGNQQSMRNIGQDRIRKIRFPLAPLSEQHRIVAEVETQFTRLDAAVATLRRVQANLKRYRASVLQAACEGRLVPTEAELARAEGRSYEPADQLLQRILQERRAKWEAEQLAHMQAPGKVPKDERWKSKYKEPVKLDTRGLPELPQGWIWSTFDQCAEDITVGHVSSMKDRYVSTGIPFLRSQNVRPLRFDPDGLEYIPLDFDQALKKSKLYGGELLVVRSGNVGNACEFPYEVGEANCSDLVITRPSTGFLAKYGAIYIVSPSGKIALRLKRTGNTLSHFNVGAMRLMPFPLPPLREQHRIVAEVERRLSVIDELEAVITANLKRAERLRQAILKRAFEGKLVPQDPTDEPASVLLERIQAERAQPKAAPKGAQKSISPSRTVQPTTTTPVQGELALHYCA